MAQLMHVYITSLKYKTYLLGYYTKINQFSDISPQERRMIFATDVGGANGSGQSVLMDEIGSDGLVSGDDNEAEKVLLEALREDNSDKLEASESIREYWKRQLSKRSKERLRSRRSRRRRKRQAHSPEAKPIRDLCFEDLVARPGEHTATEADKSLEAKALRWVVPPQNPDYERFAAVSYDAPDKRANQLAPETPRDLSEDATREVEASLKGAKSDEASSSLLGGALSALTSNLGTGSLATSLTAAGGSSRKRRFHEILANKSVCATCASKRRKPDDDIVIKDWRETGCIQTPMDQRPLTCSSCYAVSSTSFVEWKFCMHQNNVLTPLSVQYMVSCGPQYREETKGAVEFHGCNRGRSRHTLSFIKEYGVELEANLPYTAKDTQCPIEPFTPPKYKGYIRPNVGKIVRLGPKTKQLDLALEVGPVIVSFREPRNFLFYGGGMIEGCYDTGGHSMLIVGCGVEAGIEYLIIKNSFGPLWGQGGYFKFRRSAIEECVKEFISPVMSFPSRKAQARRVKAYHAKKGASPEVSPNSIALNETILF